MKQERAETMALTALGWLASHDDLMPVFMSSTGATLDDLRARAGDAEFLGSVLDFILMDDAWVVELCDSQSWKYEDLASARAALPGGEQVNWT
ncbi:MAG: DUF3572 domain-containing protein [Pseudomonadota bacterium]